jgi:hypothetical protein
VVEGASLTESYLEEKKIVSQFDFTFSSSHHVTDAISGATHEMKLENGSEMRVTLFVG